VWLYIGIASISLVVAVLAFVLYIAFNLPEDIYLDED